MLPLEGRKEVTLTMQKRRIVRIICWILAALFLISAASLLLARVAYAAEPARRDESVYVDMDADGNITSVVSSVYLGNPSKEDSLTDYTTLTNIKNIAGLDSPTVEGQAVTFKADGEDVIYQGNGEGDALPFSISITYTLDGKRVQAAELAGQSGHLCITIQVTNREMHTVTVDEEAVDMYVPFTVICMYTFDETFSNVTTSGKLTNQAGANTVMGVLMPGLRESLDDLDNESIQDTLTIETDVRNLSLPEATLIGMVGLVDESDLSGIDDVQELMDGLDEMEDATRELRDGAKELRDGSQEYTDGAVEFADGARELADGALEAADGGAKLTDGIGQTYDGIDKLYKELEAMGSMGGGSGGEGGDTGSVDQAEIAGAIAWLNTVAADSSDPNALYNVEILLTYIQTLKTGLEAVAEMQAQMQQLLSGIGALRTGVKELYDGAYELAWGLYDLAGGADELADGAVELADGSAELTDGIDELYDGLREFHRDGMQELLDETSSINVSLSRKDALLDLSDGYNAFSAAKEVENGSVQFIFTVEEIEPELPIPTPTPQAEAAEGQGNANIFQQIWAWIKGLFS